MMSALVYVMFAVMFGGIVIFAATGLASMVRLLG